MTTQEIINSLEADLKRAQQNKGHMVDRQLEILLINVITRLEIDMATKAEK